jgi:hypothetical protein
MPSDVMLIVMIIVIVLVSTLETRINIMQKIGFLPKICFAQVLAIPLAISVYSILIFYKAF